MFAVKESLVADFRKAGDGIDHDLPVNFDFILKADQAQAKAEAA